MTMYYYSTSDDFAKNRQEDAEISLEKSTEYMESLTKSLDEVLYKFNEFLKSFPMTEQEVLLEKADKFYNNKYHFVKSTGKAMWYDRAVTRMSMDIGIPSDILYVVKSVMEKGGDYKDYMSSKTYKKAIKFFKKPEGKGLDDNKEISKDYPNMTPEQNRIINEQAKTPTPANWTMPGSKTSGAKTEVNAQKKPKAYRHPSYAKYDKQYASHTPKKN